MAEPLCGKFAIVYFAAKTVANLAQTRMEWYCKICDTEFIKL